MPLEILYVVHGVLTLPLGHRLRLFRVFRVMKFSKYLTWIKLIMAAFGDSLVPLAMAMFVMSIALLIFASLLFFVEVQGGEATWIPAQRQWIYKGNSEPVRFFFCFFFSKLEAVHNIFALGF